jgi:group I intron endonuclease
MSEDFEKYYGCIYKTTNMINRKQYTGQSVYPKDVVDGKYKGSGNYISKAIKKYGYDNFKSEIIEYIEKDISLDEKEQQKILDDKETYWIEKNKTLIPNGYNLKLGAAGGGRHHEESKKKMSESQRGNKNHRFGKEAYNKGISISEKQRNILKKNHADFNGKNNPFYGKTHSKEVREKISKIHKGKKQSLKEKIKIKEFWIKKDLEICPHCLKEGKQNMKRYHFENCKLKTINI